MKFSLNDQIKKQMKHLHIVLSLLLLTSPLFGQTEETSILFHREENGKYGWYENGDEYKDSKYVGEIENGKPNGQGTETSPECVLQFQFFRINRSTFSKISKSDD